MAGTSPAMTPEDRAGAREVRMMAGTSPATAIGSGPMAGIGDRAGVRSCA
jgi:hypothetical protein